MSESKSKTYLLVIAIGISTLLMGCNGAAYRESITGNTSGGLISPPPGPIPSITPPPSTFNTSYSFDFSISGPNTSVAAPTYCTGVDNTGHPIPAGCIPYCTGSGTDGTCTGQFDSDQVLKIRITPQPGQEATGTGFTVGYTCAGFNIVLVDAFTGIGTGASISTSMLQTAGGSSVCSSAPGSQIVDFTFKLTQGHHRFKLFISRARYDWKYLDCLQEPAYYATPFSPPYPQLCNPYMSAVAYSNHWVNGTIDVQTLLNP